VNEDEFSELRLEIVRRVMAFHNRNGVKTELHVVNWTGHRGACEQPRRITGLTWPVWLWSITDTTTKIHFALAPMTYRHVTRVRSRDTRRTD